MKNRGYITRGFFMETKSCSGDDALMPMNGASQHRLFNESDDDDLKN